MHSGQRAINGRQRLRLLFMDFRLPSGYPKGIQKFFVESLGVLFWAFSPLFAKRCDLDCETIEELRWCKWFGLGWVRHWELHSTLSPQRFRAFRMNDGLKMQNSSILIHFILIVAPFNRHVASPMSSRMSYTNWKTRWNCMVISSNDKIYGRIFYLFEIFRAISVQCDGQKWERRNTVGGRWLQRLKCSSFNSRH